MADLHGRRPGPGEGDIYTISYIRCAKNSSESEAQQSLANTSAARILGLPVDEVIVDEGSGLAPFHLGQMKIFELARERAGVVVIYATRDRISRAPQNVQQFLSEADVLGVTICFAAEVHRARG